MKNWHTLDADVVRLMNKHYNAGRGGATIDMVVIHHNAGILTIDQIWDVWQTRQASAHYQVESGGRIGQLVWDRDTAWHAANAGINARSIGVEVSNSGGAAQDWPITDTAIVEAGRLTAAICYVYKLGRPVAGRNVRFHREFTSTSCPYHLAPGGKYHQRLMQAATDHYDWMAANPDGAPAPTPEEDDMAFTEEDRRMLREVHRELTQLYPSRSAYRTTDEPIDSLAGYVLNADARIHEDWVHARAAEAGMDPADWAAKHLGGQA